MCRSIFRRFRSSFLLKKTFLNFHEGGFLRILCEGFVHILGNVYEMAPQRKQDPSTECTTLTRGSSGEHPIIFENSRIASSSEVGDFSASSSK